MVGLSRSKNELDSPVFHIEVVPDPLQCPLEKSVKSTGPLVGSCTPNGSIGKHHIPLVFFKPCCKIYSEPAVWNTRAFCHDPVDFTGGRPLPKKRYAGVDKPVLLLQLTHAEPCVAGVGDSWTDAKECRLEWCDKDRGQSFGNRWQACEAPILLALNYHDLSSLR